MNIITSFQIIIILTVVSATFACSGAQSAMTPSSQNTPSAVSKISNRDWQKLIKDKLVTHHKVAWRIKITAVSYFGGFYVKGHLLDSKSARVHLIWPPEATPSGTMRDSLVEGGIVTILGDFEGVTTEQEAIISVRECLR